MLHIPGGDILKLLQNRFRHGKGIQLFHRTGRYVLQSVYRGLLQLLISGQ